MIDIWALHNEAQMILPGSQPDCRIIIRIHSAEEEQNC